MGMGKENITQVNEDVNVLLDADLSLPFTRFEIVGSLPPPPTPCAGLRLGRSTDELGLSWRLKLDLLTCRTS